MAVAERSGARLQPRPPFILSGGVPVQLRSILSDLRSEGLGFEQAWLEAQRRIVWPTSQRETVEWEKALVATKHSWRASYLGWDQEMTEGAVGGLRELGYLAAEL
jgi:uncharacterized protein (DUF2126 family)